MLPGSNNRVLEIGYQRYLQSDLSSRLHKYHQAGFVRRRLLRKARMASQRYLAQNRGSTVSRILIRVVGVTLIGNTLLNWRMYRKYSEGLLCELGSHLVTATSWFFDSHPDAVYMSGGTYRYKDGREVYDHVYATFNYPERTNSDIFFHSVECV